MCEEYTIVLDNIKLKIIENYPVFVDNYKTTFLTFNYIFDGVVYLKNKNNLLCGCGFLSKLLLVEFQKFDPDIRKIIIHYGVN